MQDRILEILNEALALDRKAVTNLVGTRLPCNQALADHPSIQVALRPPAGNPMGEPVATIGILGLLNGLFPEGHRIAAIYEDGEGLIQEFKPFNSIKTEPADSGE